MCVTKQRTIAALPLLLCCCCAAILTSASHALSVFVVDCDTFAKLLDSGCSPSKQGQGHTGGHMPWHMACLRFAANTSPVGHESLSSPTDSQTYEQKPPCLLPLAATE